MKKIIFIRTDAILASEIAAVGLINPLNIRLAVYIKGGTELLYDFHTSNQAVRTRDRVFREWITKGKI